jgi:hypothetical protein
LKRALLLITVCLILLPAGVQAQKRRTTSKKSTAATTDSTLAVHDGAARVADQIKVLTKFLYLLGGVAKGIEAADIAAQQGQASQAVVDQTERNKAVVRDSITSMRGALDKLELDFRLKPELQRYYINLAGSAAGAATAEDQAAANQFDKAGRSLLTVVNRLTDVLLEMR